MCLEAGSQAFGCTKHYTHLVANGLLPHLLLLFSPLSWCNSSSQFAMQLRGRTPASPAAATSAANMACMPPLVRLAAARALPQALAQGSQSALSAAAAHKRAQPWPWWRSIYTTAPSSTIMRAGPAASAAPAVNVPRQRQDSMHSSSQAQTSGPAAGSKAGSPAPAKQVVDYTTLAASCHEIAQSWVPAKVEQVRVIAIIASGSLDFQAGQGIWESVA